MYNKKKYGILGIIVTVIILIFLVALTNTKNSNLSFSIRDIYINDNKKYRFDKKKCTSKKMQ